LRALGFEPRKNEIKKIAEKVDKANTGESIIYLELKLLNFLPISNMRILKGRLCFTDFLDVISFKLTEKDTRDEILKAFKLFDKDQTGFITFENLQQIATELGEGLNDEEIKVSYNCAICLD
jgi:centrin-1